MGEINFRLRVADSTIGSNNQVRKYSSNLTSNSLVQAKSLPDDL